MSMDFSHLNALGVELAAAAQQAAPKMRAVLAKGAADIKRDAQIMAPVDTGNLRSSITSETTSSGDSVTTEIGPTADYGVYVEYGTSRMAPQPYLGPAFDRHAPVIEQVVAQVLGDIV